MDRVKAIRNHKNYWALPRVKEFWNVRDRLASIDKRMGNATDPIALVKKDADYLMGIERELDRLNPGKRTMIIEGKSEEVFTLYLGSED